MRSQCQQGEPEHVNNIYILNENIPYRLFVNFKGTVPRDFGLLFFFMNHFPPKSLTIPEDRIFFGKFDDMYSQLKVHHRGVVDTSGKWKNLQSGKVLTVLF